VLPEIAILTTLPSLASSGLTGARELQGRLKRSKKIQKDMQYFSIFWPIYYVSFITMSGLTISKHWLYS
jgi:hypothetical protein